MSSVVPQPPNVSVVRELLAAEKENTRRWLRVEMERLVDPVIDSIFNRLETKLINGLGRRQSGGAGDYGQMANRYPNINDQSGNLIPKPSTSSHFNPQFVNMNYSLHQPNGPITLYSISNQQQSIQSQSVYIKEECEPMPADQIQLSSYEPVSNKFVSNQNLTYQNWNDIFDEWDNDDEECDCDECVGGGIVVKEEDDEEEDQEDKESFRPVKRSRMDTTDGEGGRVGSEQSEAIDTRATIEEHGHDNSEQSVAIRRAESESSNANREEIATESTSNPTQPNVALPNGRLKCPHCPKSCPGPAALEIHLRVHTGERPFQCDQCDKRFTQKVILECHLRTHSGERPHQCRFCDKSFGESGPRNRHEQAMHLHVKPYRCKQCGHTATHRSNIIKHIRTVHFGLPPTIKEQQELNIVDDRDPGELVGKV